MVARVVKAQPALLVVNGRVLEAERRRSRIAAEEIDQLVRTSGHGDLPHVAAVVLETLGSLSVIPDARLGNGSALASVPALSRTG